MFNFIDELNENGILILILQYLIVEIRREINPLFVNVIKDCFIEKIKDGFFFILLLSFHY